MFYINVLTWYLILLFIWRWLYFCLHEVIQCAVILIYSIYSAINSAFDTVDHSILLKCLQNYVGVTDTALLWFSSYLSSRSFSVVLGQFSSSSAPLAYGLPQGSILGPVLFNIHMLPLGRIIQNHNINFHLYADDTQLYVPLSTNNPEPLQSVFKCLADIQTLDVTKFPLTQWDKKYNAKHT